MSQKINILVLNAKSGAGKDYVVSLFNYLQLVFSGCSVEQITEEIDELEDFELKEIHEVSSSDVQTEKGIDWNRNNIRILRFSEPLRRIVQACAGTDFSMEEMDMQSTKKFKPEVLSEDLDIRDMHLILSDAVKQALKQDTIFSDLLLNKLRNLLDYMILKGSSGDIIIQDARYLMEIIPIITLVYDTLPENYREVINLKVINIVTADENDINKINHSSENDIYATHPHLFDFQFVNDKKLGVRGSLHNVLTNFIGKI